tara:strand:- start:581 stop:3631 length:3051 start_codon:yes stop_codon:yes gene_type:complete
MPIIREKRQVGSIGPIGVVSSRGGDAERYRRLANATDKLTQLAISEMSRQTQISATEKAQQLDIEKITTINPKTGKPEALDWIGDNRFIGRTGADAYEKSVAERFQFSIENEIKTKATEVALKYENDPDAFQSYEREMNTYLDGMLRASERDGKATSYTNYIADTGIQYVTATKLNMMQEQNRRERAKTASEVLQKNAGRLDLIRQYSKEGKDVSELINSVKSSIADLANGGLVDPDTIDNWRQITSISHAEGVIDREFSKIGRESAARIADAIQVQDTTNLDEAELAIYNDITKYMMQDVDAGNGEIVKTLDFEALAGVATYANQSAAVEENNFQRDINASRYSRQIEIERFVTDNVNDVEAVINDFDEFDPQTARENVAGRFTADTEILLDKSKDLDLSAPQFLSLRDTIRKAYATKLIIELYDEIEGSPNDREQIINKIIIERDAGVLSGKAKGIANALKDITTIEHQGMLTEISRKYSNVDERTSEKFRADRSLFEQQLSNGYVKNISQSSSFVTASELLSEFEGKVRDFDFLSATQKSAYIDRARDAAASVYMGKEATKLGMNSAAMAAAAAYAANPNDKEGVPQEIIDMVDRAKTIGSDGFAVESRLVQMTSRLSVKESKEKVRREKAEINRSLYNGSPVKDSLTNREYVEEVILQQANNDPNYFRSSEILNLRNPATQLLYRSIESGVIPTSMFSDLEKLANGNLNVNEEEARNLLSFYTHFSSQPLETGFINLWQSTNLGIETIAKLEAVMLVSQTTNADIPAIYQQLKAANTKSMATARREALGGSVQDFIAREVSEAATNPEAVKMLTPLVKYLYATEQDADQLATAVKAFYEKAFLKSEGYILDYGHSTGSRSKFSLDAVFKGNEELKTYFVNKVNTEIILAAKKTNTIAKTISNSEIKNRAYLMPLPSSSGITGYMLVEQRGGALHPVIDPTTSIPFQFSTAEPDVIEKAEELSVKQFNELPTKQEIFDLRTSVQERANVGVTGTGTTPTGVAPAGSEFLPMGN